ncbi:hypothetical protein ACFRIB_35425 [Streptomyces mirabilis]
MAGGAREDFHDGEARRNPGVGLTGVCAALFCWTGRDQDLRDLRSERR